MKINGKRVVDATRKVTIHVTERDVANGNTRDPAGCAAALACMRDLKATKARVHLGRTYVELDDKWLRFRTPQSIRSEVVSFDRGGTFETGDFTFSPLSPGNRATGKRKGGKDQPRKRKIKIARRAYHITTGVRPHGANR